MPENDLNCITIYHELDSTAIAQFGLNKIQFYKDFEINFDVKCNSLSGSVLTQLDAFDTNISYTKTQMNTALTLYYLKREIDTLLTNYYTKTQTNDKFALYYLKTEIDTLISNYYTTTEVNTLLTKYYTKTQSDINYSNKSYVDTNIYLKTSLYNKTEIDTLLTNCYNKSYVDTNIY